MSIASEASIEGQFNHDDDLGQDPYDPLKTPTDTPMHNVSITLSQRRRRPANFTSLTYRQEELSSQGDIADFLAVPHTPGITPRATLRELFHQK